MLQRSRTAPLQRNRLMEPSLGDLGNAPRIQRFVTAYGRLPRLFGGGTEHEERAGHSLNNLRCIERGTDGHLNMGRAIGPEALAILDRLGDWRGSLARVGKPHVSRYAKTAV